MKNIFLIIVALLSAVAATFSQVKIINAANQKVCGSMSGITLNFFIEFKTKTTSGIEIDSVKSISDKSRIEYTFIKNDQGYYVINFSQDFKKNLKCSTCREVDTIPSDLTKGVIIYYKRNNKKSASFKVKKIKQLADINMP